MDRERHEPTLGTPDMTELRFRSDRARYVPRPQPTPQWVFIAGGVVLAIVVAIGLIEWNARRQAVAITRELTRPMTAQEEAHFKRELAKREREMAAQTAAELAELQRTLWTGTPKPTPVRPLQMDERCIQGRRFQRINGGWRDRPNEPC